MQEAEHKTTPAAKIESKFKFPGLYLPKSLPNAYESDENNESGIQAKLCQRKQHAFIEKYPLRDIAAMSAADNPSHITF